MEQRNENKTELKMIKMSDVQSQTVDWLWYPFIPYGKLTIIQGDPGDGKTTLVPFLLSKNSHFIAIDYRTAPHQKCRNLMQLNKSSLSPAPTQMYLISAEDFRQKEAYRIVPLYAVFCI